MRFAFSEEQEELRRGARRFLEARGSSAAVREAMSSTLGFDRQTWQAIGHELGWTALTIPEAHGGAGWSYAGLVGLMEELGRSLLPSPFFATIGLAANAILSGGTEAQQDRHLPGIAAGDTIATLAWRGDVAARPDGPGFLLSGTMSCVDGAVADLLIVAAGGPALGLYAVPATAPGVTQRAIPTLDLTRRLAEIELCDVSVPAEALLGGETGAVASAALARALDLASVALAGEQLGGAQRCLDLAVAYAKDRVQFGRPIGSFQAIKHKCAELFLLVESARSAAYFAGWVAGEPGEDLASAARIARSYVSEAYFRAAAECLQIHGGIGFTWEHDVHLHLKRARAAATLLGDPSEQREAIAVALGL